MALSVYLPKYNTTYNFQRKEFFTQFPGSLLETIIELDSTAQQIELTHPDVTPAVLHILEMILTHHQYPSVHHHELRGLSYLGIAPEPFMMDPRYEGYIAVYGTFSPLYIESNYERMLTQCRYVPSLIQYILTHTKPDDPPRADIEFFASLLDLQVRLHGSSWDIYGMFHLATVKGRDETDEQVLLHLMEYRSFDHRLYPDLLIAATEHGYVHAYKKLMSLCQVKDIGLIYTIVATIGHDPAHLSKYVEMIEHIRPLTPHDNNSSVYHDLTTILSQEEVSLYEYFSYIYHGRTDMIKMLEPDLEDPCQYNVAMMWMAMLRGHTELMRNMCSIITLNNTDIEPSVMLKVNIDYMLKFFDICDQHRDLIPEAMKDTLNACHESIHAAQRNLGSYQMMFEDDDGDQIVIPPSNDLVAGVNEE